LRHRLAPPLQLCKARQVRVVKNRAVRDTSSNPKRRIVGRAAAELLLACIPPMLVTWDDQHLRIRSCWCFERWKIREPYCASLAFRTAHRKVHIRERKYPPSDLWLLLRQYCFACTCESDITQRRTETRQHDGQNWRKMGWLYQIYPIRHSHHAGTLTDRPGLVLSPSTYCQRSDS